MSEKPGGLFNTAERMKYMKIRIKSIVRKKIFLKIEYQSFLNKRCEKGMVPSREFLTQTREWKFKTSEKIEDIKTNINSTRTNMDSTLRKYFSEIVNNNI